MSYATAQKQDLGDMITVRAFGYSIGGTVTKVTEKAIEVTAHDLAGEFKQFDAKIWFPRKALVPVAEKRAEAIKMGLWDRTVSLASWFRPDARQISLFRCGDPCRM